MGINRMEEIARCMVAEAMQLRSLAHQVEQAAKRSRISLGLPPGPDIKTWEVTLCRKS